MSDDINDVLNRAKRLREEIPHLIAPSVSDLDRVQMLGEIERLRTELSVSECLIEQQRADAMDVLSKAIDEIESWQE